MTVPRRLRHHRATSLAALAASLLLAAPALAATDSTSLTLVGGTLDFAVTPAAADFGSVNLTGAAQTAHATFADWAVNDARGTGAGWNTTVQATQFTDGSHTLPAGSLKLTQPSAVAADSLLNLSAAPSLLSGPFTIDNGSAVKVTSAGLLAGMGRWNFTQANGSGGDLALSIPPDAYAGSYSSTLTFTLGTTP